MNYKANLKLIIKLNVFKGKKTEDYPAVPRNEDGSVMFSIIAKEKVLKGVSKPLAARLFNSTLSWRPHS